MVNFEMLGDVLFDSLRSDSSRESGYVGINKTRAGTWGVKLGRRERSFKRLPRAASYLKDFVLNHLPTRTHTGLTQAYLREILDYDSETGVFTWKVATAHRVKVGQQAGSPDSNGYITIRIDGKLYYAHRLAWFYVHGVWPTKHLGHENQIKHHNWIKNLRDSTPAQNLQNRGKQRNNTSGFKGVSFHKQCNKWVARIKIGKMYVHLGLFPTPELASAAYIAAQEIHHTHRPQQ